MFTFSLDVKKKKRVIFLVVDHNRKCRLYAEIEYGMHTTYSTCSEIFFSFNEKKKLEIDHLVFGQIKYPELR